MPPSKERLYQPIIKVASLTVPALLLYEFSKSAFTQESRDVVIDRDSSCQMLHCQSQTPLTVHHLVPESFSNYNHGRWQQSGSGGQYVDHFKSLKELVVSHLSSSQVHRLNHQLKSLLKLPLNGIALCKTHHGQLHRDRLQMEPFLRPHLGHPERPDSLSRKDLNQFVYEHILPLVSLVPPSLSSLYFKARKSIA
jgi:hypothetical protein